MGRAADGFKVMILSATMLLEDDIVRSDYIVRYHLPLDDTARDNILEATPVIIVLQTILFGDITAKDDNIRNTIQFLGGGSQAQQNWGSQGPGG